ncbi:helix-turn-helix domain-containing protein [Streptomyces sp. SID11385]|uniref:helix-turn-helix domain-containing protein n=1 Tax=Streptomyces sp. SID11385 TaxID=2706031 RepID=UPI0013C5F89F|nr:helix-turn-helix domain-containing protein [Streptomyces sp. SID11385]
MAYLRSADAPRPDQILYAPRDAARVLAMSPSTLYVLMADGRIPYVKQGTVRRLRRRDLEAYADNLPGQAAA